MQDVGDVGEVAVETLEQLIGEIGRNQVDHRVLVALPQVVEISDVSGDVDYILKIVVGSMAEWNRLREEINGGGLGVERLTTHVLVRRPKVFMGYPVPDR